MPAPKQIKPPKIGERVFKLTKPKQILLHEIRKRLCGYSNPGTWGFDKDCERAYSEIMAISQIASDEQE